MLSITDISSQSFEDVSYDDPTFAEIESAIDFHGGPFVLVARRARRASYVHPGLYTALRNVIDAPPYQSAVEAGLVDALSVGQLTVPEGSSARSTASLCALVDASMAIALDNNGSPRGVFVPSQLSDLLPESEAIHRAGLSQQVATAVNNGDLTDAIDLIQDNIPSFRDNRIQTTSPQPLECRWPNDPHWVARCPCSYHHRSPCSRIGS